jgi:hypothetical protein
MPVFVRHVISFFKITACAENAIAGARENNAPDALLVDIKLGPQVEEITPHLGIRRIASMRPIQGYDKQMIFNPFQLQRFVFFLHNLCPVRNQPVVQMRNARRHTY